jgi:hypothetical protein
MVLFQAVNKVKVMEKIVRGILMAICFIFVACAPKTFNNTREKILNKKSEMSCAGFIATRLNNKQLKDSVIIYGKVTNCSQGFEAPLALVRIYDERLKMIDSIRADIHGIYKSKIISGTYKIEISSLSAGILETTYLSFNPSDSTKVDLFLSDGPALNN